MDQKQYSNNTPNHAQDSPQVSHPKNTLLQSRLRANKPPHVQSLTNTKPAQSPPYLP